MPTISFSGIASGIDSSAIIEALAESRRMATVPMQKQVDANKKEKTALEEFNTKLLALQSALDGFSSLSGGAIQKVGRSSNSDAIEVSANNSAIASTTSVEVLNLAQAAALSFDDRFASVDEKVASGLAAPVSLNVSVGTGESLKNIQVSISSATSLSDLVVALNDAGEGLIQASLANTGTEREPSYALVIRSVETGLEEGSLSVEVPPELQGLGRFAAQNLQQAEDAKVMVRGIGEVTRSSNTISDLIPGLTLVLKQENTGPVDVTVGNDAEKTSEKVQKFVDALNDLIKYSNENSTVERVQEDDDVDNVFGTLARTRLDEQAIASIRTLISGSSATNGTSVRIFADLGITIERDGTYKLDADKFEESLAKDPNAVGEILTGFADKMTLTNGLIPQYTRYKGQIELATDANDEQIESLNDRIQRIEELIEKQTERLRLVFANLESTMSKLNSDASTITSVLSQLSKS